MDGLSSFHFWVGVWSACEELVPAIRFFESQPYFIFMFFFSKNAFGYLVACFPAHGPSIYGLLTI
jgi:hypothetical protein